MYRTRTCGELRLSDVNQTVTLAGWVQRIRKMGGMTFIDLRDRYGITQLVVEADADPELVATATSLGREFVIQVVGDVLAPSMVVGKARIISLIFPAEALLIKSEMCKSLGLTPSIGEITPPST